MDYGGSAPNPEGRMGEYAIQAATSTHAQLKPVFGVSDAETWKRVAVTPMIGRNDVLEEVFTLDDANQLVTFAREKHLAWLSMWSGNRDRQCDGGAVGYSDSNCSSVLQSPWAFSKALAAYTG
jgi:hypothetical protein